MTYTKNILCGDKEITVSSSTQAEVITESEYISAHSAIPQHDYSFWSSVGGIFTEANADIRGYALLQRLLDAFPEIKSLVGSKPVHNNTRLEHEFNKGDFGSFDDPILLGIMYFYIPVDDSETKKVRVKNPDDYYMLLDVLCQYVADEWVKANQQAAKKRIGSKKPKLTQYAEEIDVFLAKNKAYIDTFMKDADNWKRLKMQTAGGNVLCIDSEYFFEASCGFDINEKLSEINAIQEKIRNSYNLGEADVEYALKWFMAANSGYVASIKNDCESRYRFGCIVLNKPDFINDPQEYDHILVCSAGVVLIETKHWKGSVEIRPDGKWLRKVDSDSPVTGIESPKFQMRRHEVLMQNILPNIHIPVHSLLCFSNASIVIDGRDNFKDYPIVTVDQLEETLSALCADGTYTKDDVDRMVAVIEAHKKHAPESEFI